MYIGNRVRQRREDLRMTQAELAKKAGYENRAAICMLEGNKRTASLQKVIDLAAALDVTPSWLMGEENNNPLIQEDERAIDARLEKRLRSLSPEQVQRMVDFLDGMLPRK